MGWEGSTMDGHSSTGGLQAALQAARAKKKAQTEAQAAFGRLGGMAKKPRNQLKQSQRLKKTEQYTRPKQSAEGSVATFDSNKENVPPVSSLKKEDDMEGWTLFTTG